MKTSKISGLVSTKAIVKVKKARQVEIDPFKTLEYNTYDDLLNHAYNSSMWYATTYVRCSGQVRKKLLDKGYPDSLIKVKGNDGKFFEVNFIDKAVNRLIDFGVIDDEAYARAFVESKLNKGIGLSKIRFELALKGVNEGIIEDTCDEIESTSVDNALLKTAERITRSSSFKRLDSSFKRKQKLVSGLMGKGFSYPDISTLLEIFAFEED